ncbi:MAG: hypothetical protein M3Z75_29925 [Actinomycetota bacterium]|nr:hypothetical protein [Actinomycetota bacterium]
MTRAPAAVRGLAPVVLLLAGFLGISGCGGARPAAAAAQPPVVPGEATQGPDLSGVRLPDFVMPLIHGGLSLPNPKLTPGAIRTTDVISVCTREAHAPMMGGVVGTAVLSAYGYTSASAIHKHILDLLVPYNLGGAAVKSNLWPAATSGTGFYQKVETDKILRQMVCRGQVTLSQAQQALKTNWYSAWLRYVVATGHV